jgi:sugar transferase EpsL
VKRYLDLIISSTLLFILGPLLLIVALIIYFLLGKPIFFLQVRPGLKCKPFEIIKFRTMKISTNENGETLSDEVRLTALGSFLRSTSIDEIPGLWNVIRGEMSLVGPRPLLMEYLPLYTDEQMRRHEVYPGVTGWAQVNGRNDISWEEKFRLDNWYVNNMTIWLDLKILCITIVKILKRENTSKEGHATTEYFKGNNN